MSYEDFVWFILSEEDKSNELSLEYWFRCVDLDCDGRLRPNEMLVCFGGAHAVEGHNRRFASRHSPRLPPYAMRLLPRWLLPCNELQSHARACHGC